MSPIENIRSFLGINIHRKPVRYEVLQRQVTRHYERQLVRYHGNEGDEISAYLFLPLAQPFLGYLLAHHQHAGQRHLGKSEIAGIAGDPFQAFGPALAQRGVVVLAPDSICFEDRRKNRQGIEPDTNGDADWLQHYNEMCYRLLNGKLLMKKVVEDSSIAVSLLVGLAQGRLAKIGTLGHSYGGNTVLFHSPFDDRIRYSCSSGAVCSYQTKFVYDTGIEMAEVIPGFTAQYDIDDLLAAINTPRQMLVLAADQDKYSRDARTICDRLKNSALVLKEFEGGHALDRDRFAYILDWFVEVFSR